MSTSQVQLRRGSPLAMIMMVMAVWVGGRAVTWENPFPIDIGNLIERGHLFSEQRGVSPHLLASNDAAVVGAMVAGSETGLVIPAGLLVLDESHTGGFVADDGWGGSTFGHQTLWMRANSLHMAGQQPSDTPQARANRISGVTPISPPFGKQKPDRWSIDAWGFVRQGSNAGQISQGRVPVYGASQIGANVQYRAAPASSHDPRLFLRGYRALVSGGETELAAGVSARPIGRFPVRVAAELRATENRFGTEVRPAAFAVTEIAPQDLPAGFTLEAYGGAGYVGGAAATAFVDGQVAVTRAITEFEGPVSSTSRLSVGGGAWGGAQEGASRVDVGPTVRLDLSIGSVPARVSVDWRERVGGDASPDSGVAATLSTRF